MKTLYNTLIEKLLNVDNQTLDNQADKSLMHMWGMGLGLSAEPNKYKYDSKKKVVKTTLGCFDVWGEHGKPEVQGTYSLDQWTVDGTVSFDCSIFIHSSALLRCNLKYSMLNHIGKLIIFRLDRGDTYKDFDNALKNFFDVYPNKDCKIIFWRCPSNEVMQMPVWSNVAGVEMVYDPKDSFDPLEYKDITAKRIRITNMGYRFVPPRTNPYTKSLAKNMNDLVSKYGNSDEFKQGSLDICHCIKKMIENNTNTKIFLTYNGSNIAEYCTLDHTGDVKIQHSKGVQWFKA